MMVVNLPLISVAILTLGFLMQPKVRKHELWRATITPLASVILYDFDRPSQHFTSKDKLDIG